MNLYEAYARKICREGNLKPGAYAVDDLNVHILGLPFGEMASKLAEIPPEKLPILGQDISLNKHMQDSFFSLVNDEGRNLTSMIEPVLVDKQHLKSWSTWSDWKTLETYLTSLMLTPFLTFRNKVVTTRRTAPNGDVWVFHCFVADIRISLNGDAFTYSG